MSTTNRMALLSLALQIAVTLILVLTLSYLIITQTQLPDAFTNIVVLTLGFWFGRSTRTDMNGMSNGKENGNG